MKNWVKATLLFVTPILYAIVSVGVCAWLWLGNVGHKGVGLWLTFSSVLIVAGCLFFLAISDIKESLDDSDREKSK